MLMWLLGFNYEKLSYLNYQFSVALLLLLLNSGENQALSSWPPENTRQMNLL